MEFIEARPKLTDGKRLVVLLTDQQRALVAEAANLNDLTEGAWVRTVILREARSVIDADLKRRSKLPGEVRVTQPPIEVPGK